VLIVAIAAAIAFGSGCGESGDDEISDLRPYIDALQQRRSARIDRLRGRVAAARREVAREPSPPADAAWSGRGGTDLDELGAELGAEVGATIGPPGAEPLRAGSLRAGSAWSTIKVPIALAVGEQGGGLDPTERELVSAAITRSDNAAAAQLFGRLGALGPATAKVTGVLRSAGDQQTQVSTQGRDGFSTYGQTEWSLVEQQRFMGALLNGCIGEPSSRELILEQMRNVTSDTWGLGSAGVPALWKGGWGPGTDGRYLVRQMGAIEVGGSEYAVTLAAIPDDGQFATAQGVATEIARWLVEQAPTVSAAAGGC